MRRLSGAVLRGLPRALTGFAVIVALVSGGAVVAALDTPGTDAPMVKVAEWARDHGLNWLVTGLEQAGYAADRPAVGGAPTGGIPTAAGAVSVPSTTPSLAPVTGGTPLPGEGVWQTVVAAHGRPAVQVTTLRVDPQHTSFLAGVMRLDPRLVRGELHPGTTDPGGAWHASTSLAGPAGLDVAAAFNGGFKLSDPSHNGYYSEGRTARPLVDGKASLVLRRDGTADVGAWGSEVTMGPDVASVRQNLVPLVDGGRLNPDCASGGPQQWGSTIGQAAYVHRSGFGVTADGTEIYVGGPALSVCTLGRILIDAGVVRGMELDINPNWVSGTYFHDAAGRPPRGFRLFPAEAVAPQHYLSASSRDWYAWYLRQ
ncbi:MAG: hypothetical protein ABS81_02355 [Pseudonocardia sp. SCN 72-86]|nr:MAG: hypothetical protein ABS81_02355 [Pseudonocardia sp. SCN 72-86]